MSESEDPIWEGLDDIMDGLLFEKKKLLESVQRVDHLVLDVFRLKKRCLDKENS